MNISETIKSLPDDCFTTDGFATNDLKHLVRILEAIENGIERGFVIVAQDSLFPAGPDFVLKQIREALGK